MVQNGLNAEYQFFVSSALCLGLFTAARMWRTGAGGLSIHYQRGQKAAGLALGLTLPQTYRYVLLPNNIALIIPPMTSEMLNLVENSAIASTIGLIDMAAQANKLLDYSAKAYESFTAITLAYVFINVIIMLIMHWLKTGAFTWHSRRSIMYEFDWEFLFLAYLFNGWHGHYLKITITAIVISIYGEQYLQ